MATEIGNDNKFNNTICAAPESYGARLQRHGLVLVITV